MFYCPICSRAQRIIEKENPDLVLLDIQLQGPLTGIDLAKELHHKNIAFVYLSANSNRQILDAAKATKPYGFLVKPFREKDVLVMLDVAWYLHQQNKAPGTKDKPVLSDAALQDEFPGIVGNSKTMAVILDNIKIISQSQTSVLILGESGTGKELVAQAIHRMSLRRNKPLVVVNCAALPATLVESELFGHEKGAFTGANNKRIGKFEFADGGTIFLDEIGELPLDLQVKFLRVLQEQEVEPIGGRLKKIDVRVIAATNRHLEEEMAAGRFRIDLYYRLNVFPINLPPLRERKSDIPLLSNHFLQVYAKRENKKIARFSEYAMKMLLEYRWPGNVRELENIIERSVLLADSPIIASVMLPGDHNKKAILPNERIIKTMEENERDHIVDALNKCGWKIHGPGGAAEMLDINSSTLSSRIRKLGIKKNK